MSSTLARIYRNNTVLYQPWRENDFLSSESVRSLPSDIHRWAYRTLLQSAFVCTERPYLPDDDTRLWFLAGCDSRAQWDKIKAEVRNLFSQVTRDGTPLLYHQVVLADWERIEEMRKARKQSAKVAATARWQGSKTEPSSETDTDNEQTHAERMPDASETDAAECQLTNQPTYLPKAIGSAGRSVTAAQRDGAGAGVPPTDLPTSGKTSGNVTPTQKLRLPTWKDSFEHRAREIVREKGFVLTAAIPDLVYQWIDRQVRAGNTVEDAIEEIYKWLEDRSLDGLNNPNVIWNRMPSEIGVGQ